MEPVTSLLACFLVCAAFFVIVRKRPKNYPPGPSGLPVVGFAPFLGANPGETFMKLKKKYGAILSVNLGAERWVVLNDLDVISAAFVQQADVFSGRPSNIWFEIIAKGHGLVFSDDEKRWKLLRKIGTATIRGRRNGLQSLEEGIRDEVPFLLNNLESNTRDTLRRKISMAVTNTICRVTVGSRLPYDDKNFEQITHFLVGFFSDDFDAKMIGLIMLAPVLRHFPIFRGVMRRRLHEAGIYSKILLGFIDKHRASYDKANLRDFIDRFLREMEQNDNETDTVKQKTREEANSKCAAGESDKKKKMPHEKDIFCDAELIQNIRELFEAGSGASTSFLMWSILAMVHFPCIQARIAAEIDNVIGRNVIPSMTYINNMPYTCAFIQEILRHRTLGPLGGVFHKNKRDVLLSGYLIPEGTTIVANHWAVHHDPANFEDPETFKPERFIGEKGDFIKSSKMIPFSVGPRQCPGMQLAKTESFIYLTSIVQKYRIIPKGNLPPFEKGSFNAFSYEPISFEVTFEKR